VYFSANVVTIINGKKYQLQYAYCKLHSQQGEYRDKNFRHSFSLLSLISYQTILITSYKILHQITAVHISSHW